MEVTGTVNITNTIHAMCVHSYADVLQSDIRGHPMSPSHENDVWYPSRS